MTREFSVHNLEQNFGRNPSRLGKLLQYIVTPFLIHRF